LRARKGFSDRRTWNGNPFRNVITKAVGAKETIDVAIVEQTLEKGDRVILCSDGLHGMINDEQMLRFCVEISEP